MPRDPGALTRALLGRSADEIEPLVVWSERGTYRVTAGSQRFVVKTDDDHATVAREVAGQQRAAAAGVPVPEVVAATDDAFAMKWVDGMTLAKRSTPRAWSDTGAHIRVAHDLGGGPPFGTGFGGFEPQRSTWREFFEIFADRMLRDCQRDLDFPADQATRIRDAVSDAAPLLDAPYLGWCHGDFQPDHVLINPATDRVVAIIDWADHGSGDAGWDVAVLTLDDRSHLEAFLAGYGATDTVRASIDRILPLYVVVRLLGSANWLAVHDHPLATDHLDRAISWRPTIAR